MKGKLVTMVGIAGVFGAVSIFAADMWLRSAADSRVEDIKVSAVPAPSAPEAAFGTIVVAKGALRFGQPVAADMLAEIPWSREAMPEGAFETAEALLASGARVVLSPIEPNEPVLLTKLSGPDGRATLSNLLTPGKRAVTIRTDEIAGVGGFVRPGDRVDVVLTRDAGAITEVEGNAAGARGSTVATEVVVENARVLTVGQEFDERQTAPQVADSVTIEVSPEDAKKVALARNVGSLSFSLRSAGEAETGGAGGVTTISSFGGSVASGAVEAVSVFAAEEPARKLTTVVVTRGMKAESYEVISQDAN